ncbi:hypothetical protein HBI65_211170 [Parastagonospora nodorum]|nr:hypothetical protein HBH74_093610 [Parastagonospora nodorum]KAH4946552.1 hypothetical protein HBH73_140770 [Parastagonospora nodorum]KAH5297578.1 hypothetical protein HBI11_158080 [Parastagonospora nodorum]KAH5352519.1 hypothetical protein HBI48_152310 [Parastagonospora nodorum]KAH5471748.1 hypothetical protein HBI28_143150 [Parastagonospora nodorum]
MAIERQTSALPPAQPSYILRGHASQIHSVRFVRRNSRLLTGDADGWIVYWKLETKRALAVWKAHEGAILGAQEWGRDKLITHGRDNSLRIWQLRASDEPTFSTVLPAEDATTPRPKPWLLYTLPVNTLNFCAFSLCSSSAHDGPNKVVGTSSDAMLVATPSTDDKKINIYQFPEEKLRYVVPIIPMVDSGMVMAVKLVHHTTSNTVLILSGYEGGLTAVHRLPSAEASSVQSTELIYLSQPHTQPILSLDISADNRTYFTSAADAVIAAHIIPDLFNGIAQGKSAKAQNAPLPATSAAEIAAKDTTSSIPPLSAIRSKSPDISLTDSNPTLPLSFSKQPLRPPQPTSPKPAGLSSLLASAPSQSTPNLLPQKPPRITIQQPHKSTNTKHSGQQSLRVRSDGRILATGGWDTRIRIYSTKTLKEVAVLKWHKEGIYAVDFAEVLDAGDLAGQDGQGGDGEVVRKETGLGKLQKQREQAMQLKHWIVAGAKDGKVSLWEVF